MLGTGGGLWLAGGLTLGFTLQRQRRAQGTEDLRGSENISPAMLQRYDDDLRDRDRLRAATIGLWSLAGVATAIGLVLLRDRRR